MTAGKPLTNEGIDEMTLPELRSEARKIFEPSELKGLKKAQLQELLKTQVEAAQAEDDELDDEVDDETEGDMEEMPTPEELAASEDDELDDELEDDTDEVIAQVKALKPKSKAEKSTPPEPSGETYTAKQVATRLGTDSKTLRKFFRSSASTIEPVGQGGRYEFAKEDIGQIGEEFKKWNSGKTPRTSSDGTKKDKDGPKKRASRMDTPPAEPLDDADEELDLDDEIDDEPSTEELDTEEELTLDDELDDDELED